MAGPVPAIYTGASFASTQDIMTQDLYARMREQLLIALRNLVPDLPDGSLYKFEIRNRASGKVAT